MAASFKTILKSILRIFLSQSFNAVINEKSLIDQTESEPSPATAQKRWIPKDYYNRFATSLFELNTEVNYFSLLNTFKVKIKSSN